MEGEPMSNVKWLIWRARALANDYGWEWMRDTLEYADIKRLRVNLSHGRIQLATAEAIAEICGLTIAEAMLAPEITDCEWYVFADRRYFADNVRALAKEHGSVERLAKAIGSYGQMIRHYTNGETEPLLRTLQKMADKLNMEVADLFLPTE